VIGQAVARVGAGKLVQALLIPDAISASLLTADSLFAPAVDAVSASAFEGDTARYYLFRAEVFHYRGRPQLERRYADSARALLERWTRAQPGEAKRLVRLGLAYARLGRKTEAIDIGRRAAALLPVTADANSGPFVATHLAEIYTVVGEPDRAIEILEPLLRVPCWISVGELRSDPVWEPLRARPRLVALLRESDG
jgi:tetratricopeptide (TPR) repeat protein